MCGADMRIDDLFIYLFVSVAGVCCHVVERLSVESLNQLFEPACSARMRVEIVPAVSPFGNKTMCPLKRVCACSAVRTHTHSCSFLVQECGTASTLVAEQCTNVLSSCSHGHRQDVPRVISL